MLAIVLVVVVKPFKLFSRTISTSQMETFLIFINSLKYINYSSVEKNCKNLKSSNCRSFSSINSKRPKENEKWNTFRLHIAYWSKVMWSSFYSCLLMFYVLMLKYYRKCFVIYFAMLANRLNLFHPLFQLCTVRLPFFPSISNYLLWYPANDDENMRLKLKNTHKSMT